MPRSWSPMLWAVLMVVAVAVAAAVSLSFTATAPKIRPAHTDDTETASPVS